jgi:ribonuclease VapC
VIAVDASVIVAILLDEPEADSFTARILASSEPVMSPVGYWEAATRLRRFRGTQGVAELDVAMIQLGIRIEAASTTTAKIAAEAEAQFGKRTPAGLNLGDCFAYALAKELNVPLLFKGDDFPLTDIQVVSLG